MSKFSNLEGRLQYGTSLKFASREDEEAAMRDFLLLISRERGGREPFHKTVKRLNKENNLADCLELDGIQSPSSSISR